MRSPILIASSMSCVTNTIVLRTSRCSARNSSCRRARLIGSIAAERLVHQHQRRVGGERARDADALALPAGELRRVAAAELAGVEADQLEQLVHARGDPLLVPAEQPRHGRDVLARPSDAGTVPICWIT